MRSDLSQPGQHRNGRAKFSPTLLCKSCASVLLLLAAFPTLAQTSPQQKPAQAKEQSLANGALSGRNIGDAGSADLQRGEQIALGHTGCKAGQTCGCFQCHQLQGQGNATAGFPRIGGQSYLYLYESLHNFASGRRENAIMQPIAAQLSDEDMRDVSAYYATLEPQNAGAAKAAAANANPDAAALTEGGTLAAIGSAKDGVQGCQNCHGPAGAGLPPVYPFLAGQYASYLEDQMHAFKANKRKGDAYDIMADIARRLSDQQIKAVSNYYASIVPQRIVTQSRLGPAMQIGAPLGPEQNSPNPATPGQGQNQ